MEIANLERVKDLLFTLVKAQRDYKSYPPKHPLLVKRREEVFGKFEAILEKSLELPLRIEPDAVLYVDKPVYQNADKRESLAANLHRSGLRGLKFIKGLTREEIDALLFALNEELATDDSDEDLNTLLWTKEVPHIHYDAADETDMRQSWARDPAGALRNYLAAQNELPGNEKFAAAIKFEGGKPARDARNDVAVISLSPEEVAVVRRLIEEDERKDLVLQVIEVLIEVLRNADANNAKTLLGILEAVVEISVEERSFGRAAMILRALSEQSRVPSLGVLFQNMVTRLAEPKHVKALVETVTRPAESGLHPIDELDLFRYLTMLGRPAVVPLAEAMGVIEDRKMRKTFCEALAEIVRTEPNQLAALSRDNRWFVARNIAYVLGLTKNPEALKILRSLAVHSNEKVRSEAVRAAALLGPAAKELVHKALVDVDRGVRVLAFELIVPFADETTPGIILAQLAEKEFEGKDAGEKRSLAIASARLHGEHALNPLSILLTRRAVRLIGDPRHDDTRIAAAAGIAAIGTPMAIDYLKQGVAAGEPGLATACQQALREAKLL